MYPFMARPQTGHSIPTEHSFISHNSKSDRTLNNQNRTSRILLLASLAIGLSVLGTSGCGVDPRSASTTAGSAVLVASPSSVEFGTVSVGNSANHKVTVANNGSASVDVTALTISGSAFAVNGQGSLPVKLAAGSSLTFNVHFNPKEDADSTGELSVLTPASSTPATTVKLHGKGGKSSASSDNASLSGLNCEKASMSGSGTDNCTVTLTTAAPAAGLVVALSSSGSAIAVPSSVTVASGATSADFAAKISSVTDAQTVILTATEGSTSKQTSIALGNSSPSSVATSTVSAFYCDSYIFTAAGTTNCTVILSSGAASGGMGVLLASSNSAVTVPASVTVAAGASKASFAARVAAVTSSRTVTLTASTNSSSRAYPLQLGAGGPALAVNATSVPFGSTALNNPTTQSLKLTSAGSTAVTVKSVTITGAGFSISGGTFPITLNPGQSVSLDLQFNPTSAGDATGKLTITSNSSSSPTAVVSLSGTGAAHKVNLSWDAPAATNAVAGYNVYRADGGTGAYQRLTSRPNADTTYSDTNVQSGKTYDYVVKTVNNSGNESSPSNKTTVTIP